MEATQRRQRAGRSLPRRRRVVLVAATLAMSLSALDIELPAAALPQIGAQLHGGALVGQAITLYLVSSVIAMPLFGRWSDHAGRKRVLLVGISIFLVGSLLAASAATMEVFLVARTIQGLGAGALPPLAMAVAADTVPAEKLGSTQGIMNAVFGVSAALGPLGGAMADALSWRWIFLFLNVPLGIAAGTALALFFQAGQPTSQEARPDQALRTSLRARATGWLSPVILCCYSVSALFGATIFLLYAYLPLFAQAVLGRGVRETALLIAPLSLAWTVTGIGAGKLMERRQASRGLMLGGALLIGLAWTALLLLLRVGASAFVLVAAGLTMALLGAGAGALNTPSTVIVQQAAPKGHVGVSIALMEALYSIGGAGGVSAAGFVYQSGGALSAALQDARVLLSPTQARLLVWQRAEHLHAVYLLACLLSAALLTVVALLVIVSRGKSRRAQA